MLRKVTEPLAPSGRVVVRRVFFKQILTNEIIFDNIALPMPKAFFSRDNYERSNAVSSIDFLPSSHAGNTAAKILRFTSQQNRQMLGEELLGELNKDARIGRVKLKISDTKQYHKRRKGRVVLKRYGYYRPRSQYIYIQNRTAVRGQILAPKTFLATLLHEWMHHYDFERLHLRSIHTKGFYQRLYSLKERLKM